MKAVTAHILLVEKGCHVTHLCKAEMGCMFNGNAHLLYGKKQSRGLAGNPWLKFHWILYNEIARMSPCRQVPLELIQWFDMNSAVIAEQQSNPLYKIQSTCCVTAQSVHFTVCFPIEASSTYRFCSSVCSLACSLRALTCPCLLFHYVFNYRFNLFCSGKRIQNVEPSPCSLSAQIVPR